MKRHVNNELWGTGYVDRMNDNVAPEVTYKLEQALWKSYEANKEFDDEELIKAYMGHFPHGGVGDHLLDHIGQIYHNDSFQAYDTNQLRHTPGNTEKDKPRGDLDNIIKYGSKMPPEFKFSALTESRIPIHIFSAGHD